MSKHIIQNTFSTHIETVVTCYDSDCTRTFTTKNGSLFCKLCRSKHQHDLLEIVFENHTQIYNANTIDKGVALLKAFGPMRYRLDLHNVLDKLPIKPWPELGIPSLSPSETIVISYVGKLLGMRASAAREIQERIATKQVCVGVLVFNRARRKATLKEKHSFHAVGSKAWLNAQLLHEGKCIFWDDSFDHIESARSHSLLKPWLDCVLIDRNDNAEKIKTTLQKHVFVYEPEFTKT